MDFDLFERRRSRDQDGNGRNDGLARHVNGFILGSTEAEIGNASESDLAHEMTVARKNVSAVASARPNPSFDVTFNAVGNSVGYIGKDSAAGKCVAGRYGINPDV